MRRHRLAIALAASFVVHGLMMLWMIRRTPSPSGPPNRPIAIDLRYLPPPARRALPTVAPVPSRRAPALKAHASASARPQQASPAVAAAPSTPVPSLPLAVPAPADAPSEQVVLVPSLPSGLGTAPVAESHGHTLRNEPGSEPDPKAQAAYDAERAARKIQGWALEGLADARAQRGLVSPYFDGLKNALEEELAAAPPPIDKKTFEGAAKTLAIATDHYTEQLSRYGRTGNPMPELDPDVADVQTRNSANAQAMLRDPGGNTSAGAIGAAIEGMAPMRQLAQRVSDELKLSALVELLQARDGKIRSARITRTSGNKAFDDGVLAAAPKAVAKLGPPSGPGLGTHAEEIRSLWEFQGRLHYKKKAKDLANGSNPAAVVLSTAASILTGQANFDETTGDVSVLDLQHPTLELKAKLLRLY